jgi:hypothetical protein
MRKIARLARQARQAVRSVDLRRAAAGRDRRPGASRHCRQLPADRRAGAAVGAHRAQRRAAAQRRHPGAGHAGVAVEHERRIGPLAGRIGDARPVVLHILVHRPGRHRIHERARRASRPGKSTAPSATSWCAASASAASGRDGRRPQPAGTARQAVELRLRAGGQLAIVAAADRAVPEQAPAVAAAQADEFFRPPVARRLRNPVDGGRQRRAGAPGQPDGADAGRDPRPVRRHRPARRALSHHRHARCRARCSACVRAAPIEFVSDAIEDISAFRPRS